MTPNKPSAEALFIFVALGSRGDIAPLLSIGEDLVNRGREVLFITHKEFCSEAIMRGFRVLEAPSNTSFDLNNPQSPNSVAKFLGRSSQDWMRSRHIYLDRARFVYDAINQHHWPDRTVVVARSGLAGARIARERLAISLATIHHSPASLRSRIEGLRLPVPSGEALPLRLARDMIWRASDAYIGAILLPGLNAFRSSLGLPPVRRLFDKWAFSPDLNIGLFPSWYAGPQTDWPKTAVLSGFPLRKLDSTATLPTMVGQFIATGEQPVVLTIGSHGDPASRWGNLVTRAIEKTSLRFLILGGSDTADLNMNGRVLTCHYADLEQVLPMAKAIVHHGGIGTMAISMATATPQIISPLVGDHWDAARRVDKAGLGRLLRPRSSTSHFLELLREVTESAAVRSACQRAAGRMKTADGVAAAAQRLDMLAVVRNQLSPPEQRGPTQHVRQRLDGLL